MEEVIVMEVLKAHITDSIRIYMVQLYFVANAENSLIRDVEETIIDLNLWKSVKPHVGFPNVTKREMMVLMRSR